MLKYIEIFLIVFLCFLVLVQYFQVRRIVKSFGGKNFKPDSLNRMMERNSELSIYLRMFLEASDKELDHAIKMVNHYDNCSEWDTYKRIARMRAELRQRQMDEHHVERYPTQVASDGGPD